MNSTDIEVLLVLGLLDDKDKVPSLLGTQEKNINTKNDNINPPSDVMTGDKQGRCY